MITAANNITISGSCWAFASTGAMEAHHRKVHGDKALFSEQQLLDCSYGYGDFGCNGGFPARAFEYVRQVGGIEPETDYPYEMETINGSLACKFARKSILGRVKRVVNITEYDEEELQFAVARAGPVTICYVVASDFRLYSGGVYSTKECGSPKAKDLTHAVVIVGYGVTDNDQKYWIVKNSWGEKWGILGYFLIERGSNMCGLADCASYPVMD